MDKEVASDREAVPRSASRCWCGNDKLEVFSAGYFHCARCETLVAARMPDPRHLLAGEDEQGFYGHRYFESYQVQNLGLPPIAERARRDLAERCVHWLRALLRHKLPPARVLELGSAHGGFVALMRWAGYEATGLDLSSWVVNFARETFGVPMLQGPIEKQPAQTQSLDAVVLMDVLEHLPDPVSTLQHCVALLKPDGILLIQTPSYREGKSLEEMVAAGDEFVKMLLPDQHLYLFSKRSVAELLRRVGAGYVQFEPAIFAAYDMFLIGTMAPASVLPEEESEATLCMSRDGRLVRALLDLRASFDDLTARLVESEADRAARLRVIMEQGHRLAELDDAIKGLSGQLEAQQALLAESDADRTDDAKAEVGRLGGLLAQRDGRLIELDAGLASEQRALERAQLDLKFARETLERLQTSYVYRLLRRLGLWEWLCRAIARVAPSERAEVHRPTAKPLERIVVDLTPVLPGGENGGAKVMTIELLRQFSRLATGCEFILLTSEVSHDELAFLDSANMRRHCVRGRSVEPAHPTFLVKTGQRLARILTPAIIRRLRGLYRVAAPVSSSLLRQLRADVLFCPFTAPFFFDPRVPTVSVIHDLQFLYHPHFFDANDRSQRDRSFREACSAASRLVCVSDHVRQTVLKNAAISPDRVETIHTSLSHRVAEPSLVDRQQVLDRYDLEDGEFLIYPANFWPHKNHEMLLTAFGMYRARHQGSKLKLVLTGAPGKRLEYIRAAARHMGLDDCVVLGGYLPDSEFAALLWSSLALIFPSLYEGFGMPVLEAMAAGKPVLCSNAASLSEIAGDAAILFDPGKPDEIADAIARLTDDPKHARELAARGLQRARLFGRPQDMASRYLRVFQEVAGRPAFSAARIHGVYSDGWAAGHLVVTFGEGPAARKLTVELSAPEWASTSPSTVRVLPQAAGSGDVYSISRGETVTLARVLPPGSGFVEIDVQPEFQPVSCGMGPDTRWIGSRFHSARIVSLDGTLTALESDSYGA